MEKRLNLLMICHHRRNKASARSYAMAKHLVQRGHRVSLIVIAEQNRFGVVESLGEGVRIIETPDLLWGRLRSGWDFWNMLNRFIFLAHEKESYDLVHCFETRPATIYPALSFANQRHIPLLTDWNDWFGRGGLLSINRPAWYRLLFGGLETYYEEAFRGRASGTTVISTALANRAAGLGIPRDRICYLSGGVQPEVFQDRDKEACRARIGLPFSSPILGFSSADSHLDLDMVMAALAIVARKYPNVLLMITGKTGKNIEIMARKYQVENHVYFTGYLLFEELPYYLGCADLFLLPFPERVYNVGRWPNKIGEYMSLGRPIVSNPVGDVKSLFRDHQIGLLSDWDPQDFAQKIIHLIEYPQLADDFGKNARRAAVEKYDWRVLIRKLEEFYNRVLEIPPSGSNLSLPIVSRD